MSIRIGFYICHCGINIAHKVRVTEVAEFAATLPNVVVSRDYKFMCSDPGQEMIEQDISTYRLNRVVVASCSPRLHEKTFQGACQRAGLNPYLFQMASVREQVSWVTSDETEATRKAKTLAAAAIRRVGFHGPLETREVGVHPDVMVVGGGIAGMQAALDIGAAGHHVYLVEKETTIGGHMLQFDKTFPTLDCAACIGTPKMVEVAQEPNIELFSYSEVKDVSGYIGNYRVKILRKPRYIKEGVCTGCGECARVCPVSVPSEWDEGLADRKAIYRSFPQAVPITFCIEKKDRAPCVNACPAHANVQGYIQLIKMGKFEAAVRLIMEKIPLPGVLGRVCPHPCEAQCRREEVDEPVAIRDLKRFAADQVDFETLALPSIVEKETRVAVIGSGPAGLTAAYDLRKAGYQVTVFEAFDKPGGMLRYGIPDYRLPPSVLDAEIGYIQRMGVKIRTGVRFGRDIQLEDLEKAGFAATFFGIGAHECMNLGIPGEDGDGNVMDAVCYLRTTNDGENPWAARHVVVIGGGNVAIDAVRVAKRLGAENVTLLYRRTEEEMPAFADEIQGAREEGVDLQFLTSPVEILRENGVVCGIRCIQNELGAPDASGRRRPLPVAGSEFVIECDAVIPAIGQRVDLSWQDPACSLECTPRDLIAVDPITMQTSRPGVFAAGDAVVGPATVIEAVGAAHRAAAGIIEYLEHPARDGAAAVTGGFAEPTDIEPRDTEPTCTWNEIPVDCPAAPREHITHLDWAIRLAGFDEESTGLTVDQAQREAARCLNCGVCSECMACVEVCEAKAIDHTQQPEEIEVDVGSIILATGYDLMDPTPIKQFGYGEYPNVFTSLEFERLSNATGPTGGKILMRDDAGHFTDPPQRVGIVHCVGSRDVNYHEYCSRVCCMYALKYSHLIHEKVGAHAEIYDFYIDQRCFGKGYEEFYRRCQEEGTYFVRGKVAEVTDEALTPAEAGHLIAIAEDTLQGRILRVPLDMVILCAAMEARPTAGDVGRTFGVNQGADGFFLEEHPKLGPLSTATDGVFLAGACQSPKDIPDTVAQASGAAVKALSLATRGRVAVPSTISWIDPDLCAGCEACIPLCPYGAIEFDPRRSVSVVNEAVCKGCGSCSGHCPSGAAQVRHFQKRQVFAEIDGLMDALLAAGT